ncbi:hypothetical protein BJ742DRAFT_790678 [Cladochytrium replicatum]|nr:hypothetical protein BJ742DRAFT_790678 [Cladochytrium replicatum]
MSASLVVSLPISLSVAVAVSLSVSVLLWRAKTRRDVTRSQLSIPIYTETLAFNRSTSGTKDVSNNQYVEKLPGDVINFDKYSLTICGRPTFILSGEFHYWRLPDSPARWLPVLKQYKAAGLNTIRIYFHWGWHSPAEGVYNFEGDRDLDLLLRICEKLRIFVLAAPGPYICAETQGGGIPHWLIAKREVRIRHSKGNLSRKFDLEYAKYCKQWFDAILPIIAKHQITRGGCVLALQIENENMEGLPGVGIKITPHDDMRYLAYVARMNGIDVPFFSNDGFELNSFNPSDAPESAGIVSRTSPKTFDVAPTTVSKPYSMPPFGIDLYGFDKYIVFVPLSSPVSAALGWTGLVSDGAMAPVHVAKRNATSIFKEWAPSTIASSLDGMEAKVRSFGGGAANTPIFIPELQGGWFNHYTVKNTFDEIYRFYGEKYTRTIVESCLAQNVTMWSMYMFYGGTNWGTLGDPDVYTSYDYSASIREFGFPSGRLRRLTLAISLMRSFSEFLTRTDAVAAPLPKSVKGTYLTQVRSSPQSIIFKRRRSVGINQPSKPPVELAFFRNFTNSQVSRFSVSATIRLSASKEKTLILKARLAYKHSFIGLVSYVPSTAPLLQLVIGLTPLHLKFHVTINGNVVEGWIVQSDDSVKGPLVFSGATPVVAQSSRPEILKIEHIGDGLAAVSFKESGWVLLSTKEAATATQNQLLLICLTGRQLYTLSPSFESDFFSPSKEDMPISFSWGAFRAMHDTTTNSLDLQTSPIRDSQTIFVPCGSGSAAQPGGFVSCAYDVPGSHPFAGLPCAYRRSTPTLSKELWHSHLPNFSQDIRVRTTQFGSQPWITVPPRKSKTERPPVPRTVDPASPPNWERNSSNMGVFSFKPALEPLDFQYTSGHVLYRMRLKLSANTPSPLVLRVNIRHKGTIYVNGSVIGGHTTYSTALFASGAKNGPDYGGDTRTYVCNPEYLKWDQPSGRWWNNEVVFVIESFGLCRSPFFFDDVREPRGLLEVEARVAKGGGVELACVDIAGVDVQKLKGIFTVSGFPDELAPESEQGWKDATNDDAVVSTISIPANAVIPPAVPDTVKSVEVVRIRLPKPGEGPRWCKFNFTLASRNVTSEDGRSVEVHVPLRLHLCGPGSSYLYVNDTLIGRYHGDKTSPQRDFYVGDELFVRGGGSNTLMVLSYDWKQVDGWLSVSFREWRVRGERTVQKPDRGEYDENEERWLEEAWSGNLVDEFADGEEGSELVVDDKREIGEPYWTIHETVQE